jgi:hypothetical protein
MGASLPRSFDPLGKDASVLNTLLYRYLRFKIERLCQFATVSGAPWVRPFGPRKKPAHGSLRCCQNFHCSTLFAILKFTFRNSSLNGKSRGRRSEMSLLRSTAPARFLNENLCVIRLRCRRSFLCLDCLSYPLSCDRAERPLHPWRSPMGNGRLHCSRRASA